MNLQTTDGPTNEQKGDGDAATWLPPNKSYRCAYVSRQVHVKAKYNLWMTQSEHDAITRILTGCGAKPLARADVRTSTRSAPTTSTASPPTPTPTTTTTQQLAPTTTTTTTTIQRLAPPTEEQQPQPANDYYKNCAAVHAAGKAPLHRGDPDTGLAWTETATASPARSDRITATAPRT